MDYHIQPNVRNGRWGLRRGRTYLSKYYPLRRNAISAAKKLAGATDTIYVHNNAGLVVIRIPEIERQIGLLTLKGPGKMSLVLRKQLATWLRNQASNLVESGANYTDNRFVARYIVC